jgi:hypothetical protein
MVEHIKAAFQHARPIASARDPKYAIELLGHCVDRKDRGTFESETVQVREEQALGASVDEATAIEADLRRPGTEQLDFELPGGIHASCSNMPRPIFRRRRVIALILDAHQVSERKQPTKTVCT